MTIRTDGILGEVHFEFKLWVHLWTKNLGPFSINVVNPLSVQIIGRQ